MRVAMLLLLGGLVTVAVLILWTSPHGYAAQDRSVVAAGVSRAYPAGTDELGRDTLVRICAALLLGLFGAGAASLVASGLALFLGGFAAFSPPWTARALLYGGDLFLTLPWIFLLMLVRAALPLTLPPMQSGAITFLLLAVLGAPAFLRVNYRSTSSLLQAGWFVQAHAAGLRPPQIWRQMFPHLRPLFWTQFLLYVPACVIAEANLGTLGLGIAQPVPSWGNMLASLQSASLISTSNLIYLPLAVLVLVLVALELTIFGAHREH